MLISVETFEAYTKVYGDTLAEKYLLSAEEIVGNYLGYAPEKSDREIEVDGSGIYCISVGCRPINIIYSVRENGQELNLDNLYTAANLICKKTGEWTEGKKNISVRINAGWTESDLPEVIKGTILQIAALRQSESDSNIGVTSKSFSDSGTRVFINNRNYEPYLMNISRYKVI